MEMVSQGRPRLLKLSPPLGRRVPSGNGGSHFVAYPIPLLIQASRPFTPWQTDNERTGIAAFAHTAGTPGATGIERLRPRENGLRSGGGERGKTDWIFP